MQQIPQNPSADERYLALASEALRVADTIADALEGLTAAEGDLVLNAALSLVRIQRVTAVSPTLSAACAVSGKRESGDEIPDAPALRPTLVMQKGRQSE